MSVLQLSNANTSAYSKNEQDHKRESSLLGTLTAYFKRCFQYNLSSHVNS